MKASVKLTILKTTKTAISLLVLMKSLLLRRKGETVTDDGSGHQLYLQHELLPVHWPILTVFCKFSLVTTVMSKREIAIKNHNSITA